MRGGACLVLLFAAAYGSSIDYDHESPDPRISRVAAVVRAANRRALERLRRVLARREGGGSGALGALCAPPFPPHSRESIRWFHVPRCETVASDWIWKDRRVSSYPRARLANAQVRDHLFQCVGQVHVPELGRGVERDHR